MVAIPGLPSHLEVMGELPEFAAFLDRLADFRRVIMFDRRGTGMSDRSLGYPRWSSRWTDIIAVMDAAGSARASVAGWADGAFMAAMHAATYPERVSALVLGGLWLKALAGSPGTLAPEMDMADRLSAKIESGWRHGALAEVLAPSYADDERFRSWWRRWEVYSPTPAAAAGHQRLQHGAVSAVSGDRRAVREHIGVARQARDRDIGRGRDPGRVYGRGRW